MAGGHLQRDRDGGVVRGGSPYRLMAGRTSIRRIATDRGIPMVQVPLAWVLKNPVSRHPSSRHQAHHLPDAVAAALDVQLTEHENDALEAPYVPRAHGLLEITHLPCRGEG